MVFSSIVFLLCFLPVFLLTYYAVDKKYKNIVILFFSIFFYAWGAPKFIFVILGTTFFDFHLVRWMSHSEKRLHRRLLLTLSVSINLGLLFYFKYSNNKELEKLHYDAKEKKLGLWQDIKAISPYEWRQLQK